jgi:hypothetical protein
LWAEASIIMTLAIRFFAIAALGAGAVLGSSATGCSGGSSSSGATGFGCSQSIAGNQFCYVYTNLSSQQQTSEQQGCTNGGGTVVTSCPSANQVGCCAVTMNGVSVDECYYFGDVGTDKQACTASSGTWSSGGASGSSGGSGSGSGGSNSSSGGSGSSSGGGAGFGCSESVAGNQFCAVFSNLTSSQQAAEQQSCTSQGGSVVSSCPTANRVGCCSVTQNGIAVDECYYFGDATSDSQACAMSGGTWSAM